VQAQTNARERDGLGHARFMLGRLGFVFLGRGGTGDALVVKFSDAPPNSRSALKSSIQETRAGDCKRLGAI
jgi:hypothetical protein